MSSEHKFVVTVDAHTGLIKKVERLGEKGELTEVPMSEVAAAAPAPPPQSVVMNFYLAGQPSGVATQQPGAGFTGGPIPFPLIFPASPWNIGGGG